VHKVYEKLSLVAYLIEVAMGTNVCVACGRELPQEWSDLICKVCKQQLQDAPQHYKQKGNGTHVFRGKSGWVQGQEGAGRSHYPEW